MKVALLQYALSEDPERNWTKVDSLVARSAAEGAHLLCFPELMLDPFLPQYPSSAAKWRLEKHTLKMGAPKMLELREAARRNHVHLLANVYLREGAKCYDVTAVIDTSGTVVGLSKMVHIADFPLFHETDYYASSDTGFHVYDIEGVRVGVVICFDRHFPESIRTCVLSGAELICIPTANIYGEDLEMFAWEMRVAAMQNCVYVAICNRVGQEDQMHFAGQSMVVDPNGEVVEMAGNTEQTLICDIDTKCVERARTARPYMKLRRPSVYKT